MMNVSEAAQACGMMAALTRGALVTSVTAAMLAAGASPSAAEPIGEILTLRKIIEVGDPVPATDPPEVFEILGGHPATGDLSAPPRISTAGAISFHAYIGEDGVPSAPPAAACTDDAAIFVARGSELEMVMRSSQIAPGTPQEYCGLPIFPSVSPWLHDDGTITFEGQTESAQPFGLWRSSSAGIELILSTDNALPQSQLPGMAADEHAGLFTETGRGNSIITNLLYASVGGPTREALFRYREGRWELIVGTGSPAPGAGEGVTFGWDNPIDGDPLTFWDATEDRVAFIGLLNGPGVTTSNQAGIWVERSQGLELIIRIGDSAAAPFTDAVFAFFDSTFHIVRVNERGDVLFAIFLDSPRFGLFETLWICRAGEVELIAAGGEAGGTPPGFQGDARLGDFLFYDLSESGEVAFHATVDGLDDSGRGLWRKTGEGIELIAREGGPAAGLPDVFYSDDFTLRLLGFDGVTDRLSFASNLQGPHVGPHNDFGAFTANEAGQVRPFAREGDAAEIPPDRETHIIDRFSIGAGRSAAGGVAMEVFFTDGLAGIYEASLIPACPADLALEDGLVSFPDLVTLLQAWHTSGPGADLAAPFDTVDLSDLLVLLTSWGHCP